MAFRQPTKLLDAETRNEWELGKIKTKSGKQLNIEDFTIVTAREVRVDGDTRFMCGPYWWAFVKEYPGIIVRHAASEEDARDELAKAIIANCIGYVKKDKTAKNTNRYWIGKYRAFDMGKDLKQYLKIPDFFKVRGKNPPKQY